MKVLVVGAAGYLGRHVWGKLLESGHDVIPVDGLFWGQEAPAGLIVQDAGPVGYGRLVCDHKPDSVIWLGAIAHDPERRVKPHVHAEYTCNRPVSCLLDYAAPRSVFVSTLSVFNESLEGYPGHKRRAEKEIFRARGANIVRFGTLYGPGVTVDSHREHLLLNKMVYDALKHGFVRVANPAARRPVFGVEEAADQVCIAALCDQPTQVGNCFTFCRTILEYGQVVSKMLKVPLTVEEGVDTRDYGWEDGMGKNGLEQWLPQELEPLVEWTREHLEEIKPRRQIFETAP